MKKNVVLLVASLLAIALLGIAPASADDSKYEPPEIWLGHAPLKSMKSGQCMVPESGPLKNGIALVEGSCDIANYWSVGQPVVSATGKISNAVQLKWRDSNFCIGIKTGAYNHAHLWQCENHRDRVNSSQVWTRPSDRRSFQMKNVQYGTCLSSYKEWTGVVPQYTLESCDWGVARQRFAFDL